MFHCLPDSAWADGNLAEAAGQLGKMVEHKNQSQPNRGSPGDVSPCTLAAHLIRGADQPVLTQTLDGLRQGPAPVRDEPPDPRLGRQQHREQPLASRHPRAAQFHPDSFRSVHGQSWRNLHRAIFSPALQGRASVRGLDWTDDIYCSTTLPCCYANTSCLILICPSRIWLTVEWPETWSTQPKSATRCPTL